MTIKRVLLPFADTQHLKPIAEAAFLVGRLHQAQVRGLFVQRAQPDVPFRGEYVDPDAMRRILDNARKERDEARRHASDLFESVAKHQPAVEADFVAVDGAIAETAAHVARLADISILPAGAESGRGDWDELRDAALFRSGRPALVVPHDGIREQHFERVVIGWKESVEAARAVAAAQPFLLRAKQVHLVTVGDGKEAGASLKGVEEYLQLHYAEVRSELLSRRSGKDVSDVLQHKAEVLGGAVLVMGAYSRWRWREQIFGGVTDSVLRHARVPVVLAR